MLTVDKGIQIDAVTGGILNKTQVGLWVPIKGELNIILMHGFQCFNNIHR